MCCTLKTHIKHTIGWKVMWKYKTRSNERNELEAQKILLGPYNLTKKELETHKKEEK